MRIGLRKPSWSPYLVGIILGLLHIPGVLLADQSLGISSAFMWFSSNLTELFSPSLVDSLNVRKYISSPSLDWRLALALGITAGAFLSARLSHMQREGSAPGRTYIKAFIGGMIMVFGARLAHGCTAGHLLSGLAQFNVAAIFFAVFFVTFANFTARHLHRR
ncbi:MAG: YeeE/YedE thiosulfate transporter family protein [Alphaproteobacteria bacterium]